jgi:hypothetical protein
MSKLAVGSIEGLASEGYKITVPSGSKIIQAGAILQVVNTIKTDTFTSSTINQGAEVDITGMTATITPLATSSKILVMVNLCGSTLGTALANAPILSFKVYRGSTAIGIGDAAGNRTRVTTTSGPFSLSAGMANGTSILLDSPSTTNATTYKVSFVHALGFNQTAVFYCNMNQNDEDLSRTGRAVSTITLMEIAG